MNSPGRHLKHAVIGFCYSSGLTKVATFVNLMHINLPYDLHRVDCITPNQTS